jgi:4-amino-4-deoxy-L-arabinose transferase-like glycosyltransferase
MKKELAFLFAVITSYTFFYIDLPPWWDGITTAVTAFDAVKTNIDLYPDFFGKPPFIFITLGSLFKIFGYSPEIIHLYMLVFSLAAAYFTYKAGELLSCKEVGIASSFLLAFSPLFIAQSVNLNFDLPATALIMASYYYLLKKDSLSYVLVSTMLIMTKEVGILFIAAAGFSALFRKDWKAIQAQIIPVLIFVGWSYGNYTRHGWFLFPRDSPLFKLETIWNENLVMRLTQLFILNFNWILTFITLLSVIAWLYRNHNKIDHRRINQLMPMVLFFMIFFISVGPIRDFNLPRYVLVLYPALYLISAWAIYSFFQRKTKISAGIIISILALFAIQTAFSIYSQDPYVFLDPATKQIYDERQSITLSGSEFLEINLKYVDYVKADIELVRYLNTTDRSIPILLNRFNHYSIFIAANKGIDVGYGQKYPREYKELGDFYNSPDTISFPAIIVLEDFNKFDLEKLDHMYDMTLLDKIRVNGVGADVYQIDKD